MALKCDTAELIAQATKEWIDQGMLIEAGFVAMRIVTIPPDAPPEQVAAMRMAFFAGAQHLFGTLMSVLDKGDDASPNDLRRMDLIDQELRAFITDFAKQNLRTEGNA